MNKKAIIVSICLMASMISCAQSQQSQQPRVFGESPLLVEYLDFNMNIREFFPFDATERENVTRTGGSSSLWTNYYITVPVSESVLLGIPNSWEQTVLLRKQIIEEHQVRAGFPYISYRQRNSSSLFQLATFADFVFDKIYARTTLDNEIKYVAVVDTFGTEEIANNLLRFLNEKYGNVNKRVASFLGERYILYWELDDRIIHLGTTDRTPAGLTVRMGEYGIESIESEIERRFKIRLDIVNREFAHKFEDSFFVWWQ